MDDARAGRTNVRCKAIGAGLFESFGEGNESVIYAMDAREAFEKKRKRDEPDQDRSQLGCGARVLERDEWKPRTRDRFWKRDRWEPRCSCDTGTLRNLEAKERHRSEQ